VNDFKLLVISLFQIPVYISVVLINKSGLWMNGPGEEEEGAGVMVVSGRYNQ
jgi:hypothetical protein